MRRTQRHLFSSARYIHYVSEIADRFGRAWERCCAHRNGKIRASSPLQRYQHLLLKFKWIGCCCTGRSIWRCKVVSDMSLEVNGALAEGAKQATFEKEAQTPSGTGTPVSPPRPPGQPAETRRNKRVAVRRRSVLRRRARPNLTGTNWISRDRTPSTKYVGGPTRPGCRSEAYQSRSDRGKFSLGTEESKKDRLGEWQKKTAWHRVQVWGDLAETVSASLRQGARVYVEGKLIIRNWIDKQTRSAAPQKWWQAMCVPYAGSKQWSAKRERARRRAYRRLATTENLGLSWACSLD